MKFKEKELSYISVIAGIFSSFSNDKSVSDSLDNLINVKNPLGKFTSKSIPAISPLHYLMRVCNLFSMTKESLVLSLIYISRIQKATKTKITSYEIHRYF